MVNLNFEICEKTEAINLLREELDLLQEQKSTEYVTLIEERFWVRNQTFWFCQYDTIKWTRRHFICFYYWLLCKIFRVDLFWTLRTFCHTPFRSKEAGRFEKLLDFARSHFILTRDLVSLSCATTQHPFCFSKS